MALVKMIEFLMLAGYHKSLKIPFNGFLKNLINRQNANSVHHWPFNFYESLVF
jgi:hypothetical protein